MVGRPTRRPDRTTAVNSGRRRRRACAGNTSGGELLATLAPTAGDDRPARAGAHPQPEAVGLGPATVVRLERALAHEVLPLHDIDGAHPPVDGHARRDRCEPGPTCAGQGERAGTSTDSDQHNRGRPTTGEPVGSRPPMVHPAGSTPSGTRRSWSSATRPKVPGHRCRAVDEAVSVAVAPRRTTGSRRA